MDGTPAEPPPGCLVLLLRLSADMTADVVTGRGESVAFAAARQLADELVEGLVNTVASGYSVGAIDITVLGYRTGEDGAPQLLSLLPDGDPKPRLVPLTHLVGMPAEARTGEGLPRKWAILPPCEGEPCAGDALARVYQMVAVWLTGRFAGRSPVVIHCATAEGFDDAYFRTARSLGLLATGYGPVRLLHYLFDSTNDEVTALKLLEVSGELPENADAGKVARRALFVNDWDITDQWDAIFTCSWREDTVAWRDAGAGFSRAHALWTQKMGNTPEQWEDAYATDAASGVAAIADGASTGIYCRTWADQLSRQFLIDRPDARDVAVLNRWVNGLRTEWRAAINYDNLNWSKQAKVDSVGAAATLLGLELGPPDANGNRPWRACAVGDASLFWLREGKLLATFPVVAADQFGSAPLLVRSNPGFKTLALNAAGDCAPGDRFVLATDAVAARLFKSAALGPGPEWARFESITEDAWRDELDTLRRANDMVNDDCTLVVLRVSGGVEEEEVEVLSAMPVGAEAEVIEIAAPPPPAGTEDGSGDLPLRGGGQGSAEAATVTEGAGAAALLTSPPEGEVAEACAAREAGGGGDAPAITEDNQQQAIVPSQQTEDFVITADVGDLMIDIPRDPPAQDAPKHDEPPPTDEPPAATEGFPE